jgi:hypothetical protein
MKNFKKEIHREEFKNRYGEKMTMVMSANCSILINHEDCNDDFEKVGDKFNYILNEEEQNAILEFINKCKEILKKEYPNLEI